MSLITQKILGGPLLLACLCWSISAKAADGGLRQCAAMSDSGERLKCYDELATVSQAHMTPGNVAVQQDLPSSATDPVMTHEHRVRTYLSRAWNLDGRAREGSTQLTPLRPYRTSYLIARSSTWPNSQPYTPVAGHATPQPLDLDKLEAKFQFSFKAEVLRFRQIDWLGFEDFRLWGAYTQQSNWQAFNARNSSPFRETNYEPELIATLGTGNDNGLKLVNLGFVHQSNGRPLPDSRSWNRIYLQGGWEWENNLSVLARGWWRIPENPQNEDNPDIQQYLGYGDAVIRWEPDKTQSIALLLRNNLRLGQNRGFLQLDWSTPVFVGNSAKLHAQLSNGYGESLIDYNHRQTTIGLGLSFREW